MEEKEFDSISKGFLCASAVTVGNFDGVHLGHRAIIGKVIEQAKRLELPSVVITFDPHPREVIFSGRSAPAITTFAERARLIAEMGVDFLVRINFTPDFAGKSADFFMSEVMDKLAPKVVVIGHDFRFGKDREGDRDFLDQAGAKYDFEVESVPVVEVDKKPVSSSRIRGLIQAGEMGEARSLLGVPFHLEGEVVRGHGRGKGLGFSTANLRREARLLPPDGVYAAAAEWNGHRFPAVVNIGDNPTFGDKALSIEAHIMGFSGDLYTKRIRIALFERLRGEEKFNTPEDLVAQIEKDVARTLEVLEAENIFKDGQPVSAEGETP